jgi:hypothetical protein
MHLTHSPLTSAGLWPFYIGASDSVSSNLLAAHDRDETGGRYEHLPGHAVLGRTKPRVREMPTTPIGGSGNISHGGVVMPNGSFAGAA